MPESVRTLETGESRTAGTLADSTARIAEWLRPDRLACLLGALPGGIYVQDATHRLLFANEAAARAMGFRTIEEMLDRPAGSVHERYWLTDALGAPFPLDRTPGRLTCLTGKSHEAVLRIRTLPDGHESWALVQASPFLESSGATLAVCHVQELTERRRTKELARLLSQASGVFEELTSPEAPFDAVTRLVVPLLADACIVSVRDIEGRIHRSALAHRDGEVERRLIELMATELAAEQVPEKVIRSGEPVLIPELLPRHLAGIATSDVMREALQLLHPASYICVPLIARGRVLGALELLSSMSGRFGGYDLDLAKDVARRAALSSDNARLFDAEQKARLAAESAVDRVTRLQFVAEALAETLTQEGVARVVLGKGVKALRAQAGSLALLDETRGVLRIEAYTGYTEQQMIRWKEIPLQASIPLADAVRMREAIFIGDAAAELPERYPHLAGESRFQAAAALPIAVDGRVVGAIGLSFAATQAFEPADRAFAHALIRQFAQALDRARLYESEQAARRREEFLSKASALLSSSLDGDATLASLARLAVGELADWCIIHVKERGDGLRRVALTARDGLHEHQVAHIDELYSVDSLVSPGFDVVLGSGEPVLVREIDDGIIRDLSPDEHLLDLIRKTGVRSAMQVPLTAGGNTLGVMTLAVGASRKPYEAKDVQLAQELARRAALNLQNARLHADVTTAGRAREEFLAVVSHDLKNPLGAVLINAQMLQSHGVAPQDETRVRRRADIIVRSAGRMQRLIHDLLDTAEIDAGGLKIDPEPVHADELLAEAVELVEAAAADKGIRVTTAIADGADALRCDRERILQVLSNLLGNAVKFTPEGGVVHVELGVAQGVAHFRVVDSGPGFGPDEMQNAFNRFWRTRRSGQSGTGLGLFIARGIVEAHGGQIGVDCGDPSGSTVWFTIPMGGAGSSD